MKKNLFCLCAAIMLLCGCENGNQDKVIELDTPVELETKTESEDEIVGMETSFEKESTLDILTDTDILLSVKSANANSLELEICNKSPDKIFWSSWFVIEKERNGKWYQQQIKLPEEIVWIDILGYLEKEDTTIINENWSGKYPNISEGKYRIIKSFFFDERNQDERIYVACEFSIE